MIVKQKVKVKWGGRTRKHYEDLGYTYTKKDDVFYVFADELTKSSNVVIEFICDYCGTKASKRLDSLMAARNVIPKDSCQECSSRKHYEALLIKGTLYSKYPEISKDWCEESNELSPKEVTPHSKKKVVWVCSKKHSWVAPIYSRTNGGSGCPTCSESKGEKRVANSLDSLNVRYEKEYYFTNLIGRGGGFLKFDFALIGANNKVTALVEFDGPFHFNKLFKGDGHELLVVHDRVKNNYCQEYNLPLLRIPHWDIEKTHELLADFISKLS